MMDTILSILSGGSAGALLVWLLRRWISKRLQQSIRHEYSQKLETHKAELNTRIQAIQHENQLQQLRTSLFFDHQRNAFAELLAKITKVNQTWLDKENTAEGLEGPVPYQAYKEFCATFYRHQLFFDTACLAAINLVLDCYHDSLRDPEQPETPDFDAEYAAVEFLQPRLAELFQNRIGVSSSRRSEREIALFGAIRILNHHNFKEIELPPKGSLKLANYTKPAEAVVQAEVHFEVLVAKLREFVAYLKSEKGRFHEAAQKTTRYLEMLSFVQDTNQKTE